MPAGYEIFCSYAHADNDEGWVDAFEAQLAATYRKLTGQAPVVFIDRESLMTADIWESKIRGALERAQLLVAILSPSYVRSEWCRREWEAFVLREEALRSGRQLADEQGFIFPVLLHPLDRGAFDESQRAFAESVKARQWLDASSQLMGTPIRPDQIRRLVEGLIDAASEIQHRRRVHETFAASAESGITIRDPIAGVEWTAALSPFPLTFDEAREYVDGLDIGGHRDWRLPTSDELESLIDPAALVDDPDAAPFPLREPFNAQRAGYLQSGTPVGAHEGHWVMNVRNGHVFNGHGVECFVRAVRDLDGPR